MSYRTTFRLANPDETEATLNITMRLSEWKRLQEQLANQYPSYNLAASIRNLLKRATQELGGEYTDDPYDRWGNSVEVTPSLDGNS